MGRLSVPVTVPAPRCVKGKTPHIGFVGQCGRSRLLGWGMGYTLASCRPPGRKCCSMRDSRSVILPITRRRNPETIPPNPTASAVQNFQTLFAVQRLNPTVKTEQIFQCYQTPPDCPINYAAAQADCAFPASGGERHRRRRCLQSRHRRLPRRCALRWSIPYPR